MSGSFLFFAAVVAAVVVTAVAPALANPLILDWDLHFEIWLPWSPTSVGHDAFKMQILQIFASTSFLAVVTVVVAAAVVASGWMWVSETYLYQVGVGAFGGQEKRSI